MEDGIFSVGEKAPDVQAWEQGREDLLRWSEPQKAIEEERLGEIRNEHEVPNVGMGKNDLMTEEGRAADRGYQEANRLWKSYGGMASKIAGKGADPVTDNEAVKEIMNDLKRDEEGFRQTGDVVEFYNKVAEEGMMYRRGEVAKIDSEEKL